MDYAFLRQEGIRHLERMAGPLWTDFNVHDPGITILEQVCYAITDLSYRIAYDLPDLLASAGDARPGSLFTAAQILPSQPVTTTDLRKLVLDVEGVRNAWIEPVMAPDLPLYFDASAQTLSLQGGTRTASPVTLQGLYRIVIEKSDRQDLDGTVVARKVAHRVHAHRNLCEDFVEIRILERQAIQVQARVEIGPVEDATRLLLDIYQRLAEAIAPTVRFATLSERLAARRPVDEMFEGPLLEHGFIAPEDLARTQQRLTALRTSDLLREIMDVPGVRAVRTISISAENGTPEPWSLPLDPRKAPALDVARPAIRLERHGMAVRVETEHVVEVYNQLQRHTEASHVRAQADRDLPVPVGRDRHIGTYTSLQHQFPAAYGLGELGLPASATPQRQAQARQLQAYLLFFDQLLANYFAQLAQVRELLAFPGNAAYTYAAQMIDDPSLDLEALWRQPPQAHQCRLQALTEDGPTAVRRRHRFLNHLLARFAEQFTDYALILYGLRAEESDALVQEKQRFLQNYPTLSRARGTASNYLLPWSPANRSGLEQRLRHKLGMATSDEEDFYLVEHILLRPLDGDVQQQVPLLAAVPRPDPYSLQLSVVLPNFVQRFQDANVRAFIEQTIREETPAHLTIFIHWLDEEDMRTFAAAYKNWLNTLQRYWTR